MADINLTKQFSEAAMALHEAVERGREIARIASAHDGAFQNPYAEDCSEAQRSIEATIAAYGPLLNAAIMAGHHGRWVQRRLPEELRLLKTQYHHYAAEVVSPIGVCVRVTIADSTISDRDRYVQSWGSNAEGD